jgi:hypothetical protein
MSLAWRVEQFLELEHDARASAAACRPRPAGRLGVGDGRVDFLDGRQRQFGDLLAGRRVEHRATRGAIEIELAANGVLIVSMISIFLLDPLEDCAQFVEQFVDLVLRDDQRRRQRDDVAGGADQQAVVIGLQEGREGALGRLAGNRLQLDGADQAEIADVDDMRAVLQRMQLPSSQ